MKRSINIISLAILIFAGVMSFYLFRSSRAASGSGAFSGFPLNQPRVINFDVNHEAREDKSKREKLDQSRDWLLYAVVSDSGQSARELGEILYDLPATRDGYMRHVGNFEYGETRSRLVKDGEVVALVPAGSSERIDQLAHIADEHRKNAGDVPKTIMVFDYKLNADGESINSGEITRREAIDGEELFTAKYGYYESRIKSLADLKQFMKQIDDVVFAQEDGDALKLGGRKIQSRPYRGISVEDIAAIWQSEEKIQRGEKLVDGSGFSLDPSYNFDKLKQVFETILVPLFEGYTFDDTSSYPSDEESNPFEYQPANSNSYVVSAALERCQIDPFFDWLDSFRTTQPKKVAQVEELFRYAHRLTRAQRASTGLSESEIQAFVTNQQARYDGDLQGTEVGMVLFYTDLLAKLWDFDYEHSVPREIDDFKSEVDIQKQISPVFQQALKEMPLARLWFGPDDQGFQVIDAGRMAFARNATKLFAKSSGSIALRNEVEADPSISSFIGWWDDHFEEVGRYEGEYERLNQIMKWSLVISWLNQANKGGRLGFLQEFPVNRSHRFPEWVKRQPNLKFNKWNEGMFLKTSNRCTNTEMLPELSSDQFVPLGKRPDQVYRLSGGVSLSSKSIFAERPFLTSGTKVASIARRSHLDYGPLASTENFLKTIDGTTHHFQALATNRFAVSSTPRAEAMLRTAYGDVASGKFQHVLTSESGALKVAAKYNDTGIGTLSISPTRNGFDIGWKSRELDLSQSFARKLSVSANPDELLTTNPLVESALKLPGNEGYLIKLNGSEQWTRLMVQNKPTASLETGWHARVADLKASSKPLNVGFWDQAKVNAEFSESHYIAITNPESGSGRSVLAVTRDVPTTGGTRVTILNGEQKIAAVVDRNSNSLFVKYGDLPEAFKSNPSQLQRAISRVNIKQAPRDGVLNISDGRVPTHESLGRELASGNYQDLTKRLTNSPKEFKSALEGHLNDALKQSDDLLAHGDYGSAKNTLDNLIEVYGQRPEITIRRGVAQIRNGETASAARAFNESIIQGQGRDVLFKEVNLRLRNGSSHLDTLVQLADDGKTTAAYCEINTLPGSTRVGADIPLDSAILYVEKSPRLNNLDWNTNIQSSLKEVISGEFGEVIKLPRGSLNKFRPTEIYAADTGKRFESVRQTTTKYNFRFPVTAQPGSRCQDDPEASNGCGEIYIVRERPLN